MRRDKKCKICNKFSGKRNVCLECKTKYPYVANEPRKSQTYTYKLPFNRKELFLEGVK